MDDVYRPTNSGIDATGQYLLRLPSCWRICHPANTSWFLFLRRLLWICLGCLQKRVFPISSGPDEPIPSTYVAQIKQNYCTNQLNCGRLKIHPAECLPNQRYIWEADPLANVFAALARKGPHELKPRSERVSICKRSSTTIHKQTPANINIHSDKRPFAVFKLTSWHSLTHLLKAWVQNRIRFFGTVELVIEVLWTHAHKNGTRMTSN